MYSPLEQFDVIYLVGLSIQWLSLDISLFNVALPMFFITAAVYFLTSFFALNLTLTANA